MSAFFHWNVDQEIVHFFGPFGLRWYSLMFLGGFMTGFHLLGRMFEKEGKSKELVEPLLYYLVFGTIIGARLGHCFFYDPGYYFSNPIRILKVWEGGLASHGGFTGVIIATYLFTRKFKEVTYFWLIDRVAIVSVLAGAFIRIGNFFNSEIIGKVTEVPWAVVFTKVDNLPRHPTQLYESFGYASISLLLYLIYRGAHRKPLEGRVFGIALTVSFLFRFLIENLKIDQVAYEEGMTFNIGQWLSLPFVAIGLLLAFGIQKKVSALSWAFEEANVLAENNTNIAPTRKKRKRKRT